MIETKSQRHWLKSAQAKRLFSLCRWLHIYTSTALFSLLLFFCITGITLNHPDWTGSKPVDIKTVELPSTLVDQMSSETELPIKAIQMFVEQSTGLTSPRNIDIMPEDGEVTYDFPLPSGYAFVTVLIEDGIAEIEYKTSGFIGLLNDLHKGRHSGEPWKWLIDVSAALMLFFTLTGVIILLQNAKHRRSSLWILLFGSISPILFYWAFVPRLLL